MSSTPKYSPSSGFLPSVASATLLTRNSGANRGGIYREDGEVIPSPYRPYSPPSSPSSVSAPIDPILALNCKLNPVQTRHTHKKGAAPFRKQPTDTNNLNFTLLIFYTNFYISFNLFLSILYIINPYLFSSATLVLWPYFLVSGANIWRKK